MKKPVIKQSGRTVTVSWGSESARIKSLLAPGESNAKLAKGQRGSWGLSMSPHVVRGLGFAAGNVCPFASTCVESCLTNTGMGYFGPVQKARLARRLFWQFGRDLFLRMLNAELSGISAQNVAFGTVDTLRLNVFSDIRFERYIDFRQFPGLQAYDYTKWPASRRPRTTPGYRLVYSFDGSAESRANAVRELSHGGNVAVVFHDGVMTGRCGKGAARQPLPGTWEGFRVVDGNLSDDRTVDPPGTVIGLTLKARTIAARRAAIDSGFAQLYRGAES